MQIELKEIEKLAQKVYSLTAALNRYCTTSTAEEDNIEHVATVLAEYLHVNADKLYATIIDLDIPAV